MKKALPSLLLASLSLACQPSLNQTTDDKTTVELKKEIAETKDELDRLKHDMSINKSKTAKARIGN